MATERQIVANRRNAVKSAGPRSKAGKRRASHNSFQHGLTLLLLAPQIKIGLNASRGLQRRDFGPSSPSSLRARQLARIWISFAFGKYGRQASNS
jgi:hypothetical protein